MQVSTESTSRTASTLQTAAPDLPGAGGGSVNSHAPDTSFFVIGGIINIAMITAYFIWAYRAWKKRDRENARRRNDNPE